MPAAPVQSKAEIKRDIILCLEYLKKLSLIGEIRVMHTEDIDTQLCEVGVNWLSEP